MSVEKSAPVDKHSILIVEDDLDLAEMLNAYFRVQGYEVMTAAWGEDAVRVSQESHADIVMLDIRLPDIDGYEVFRRLRTNRRTENLPVIFLTERRDRVDRLQGLQLGAVDYITKPFDIQELRLRVRNALRRGSLETVMNPVTGLPDGEQVDEQLARLLDATGWGVLVVGVRGLDAFCETYGFVASDDVLRAISLMLSNIVREVGNADDFVGHLSPDDFLIITGAADVAVMRGKVGSRVGEGMKYFYPLKDRPSLSGLAEGERLSLAISTFDESTGTVEDVNALRDALLQGIVPLSA